jgi:hypothetical protein
MSAANTFFAIQVLAILLAVRAAYWLGGYEERRRVDRISYLRALREPKITLPDGDHASQVCIVAGCLRFAPIQDGHLGLCDEHWNTTHE